MSHGKTVVKPKLKPIRAELSPDLQTIFDTNQSGPDRIELLLIQILRELKRLK